MCLGSLLLDELINMHQSGQKQVREYFLKIHIPFWEITFACIRTGLINLVKVKLSI